MGNGSYKMFGLMAILYVALLFVGLSQANAAVSVGVNFNFGPPPQEVVAIPGDVYYVPSPDVDIFFYSGYWWTIHENRWYRSRSYNGSWMMVNRRYVPSRVFAVYRTPNYRVHYEGQGGRHVPYAQFRSQWGHHGRGNR